MGEEGDGLARTSLAEPPPSFERVYADHFAFAWRSLRLLGVAQDVLEDAAQEVFTVVSRQLPEFSGRSSVRTWLFSIVQRTAANYRRRHRRALFVLVLLEEVPAPEAARTLGLPLNTLYSRVRSLRAGLRRALSHSEGLFIAANPKLATLPALPDLFPYHRRRIRLRWPGHARSGVSGSHVDRHSHGRRGHHRVVARARALSSVRGAG